MKKLIALTISIVVLLCSVTVVFASSNTMGDTDGNGKIDIIDATAVQRYIAKIITLDEDVVLCADVDGDGKISVMDCTCVQQYVAKVIATFPCEKNEPTEPTEETLNISTDSSLKPSPAPGETVAPQPTEVPTQQPTVDKEQICRDMELEILRLVNIERKKEGLDPVEFAYDYHECAKLRAVECSTDETFSHTRPDSRAWHTVFSDLSAPSFWSAGENIALYFQSADEVVAAWMSSPGHRANILHPEFDLLAVGIYETPEYEGYYSGVQLFIASWDRYHD